MPLIKKIIIVGGGAAGWLTAGIISAGIKKQNLDIRVCLVESPDVSTIGVGEGTWPSMRSTLKNIGLSETEFMRYCGASFKQGSKFIGWQNLGSDNHYYHPFTPFDGKQDTNHYCLWQQHFSHLAFDSVANIQSAACELGLAPKQMTTPEYAGVLNYGYHLDAGKFGLILRDHCTANLGVEHIVNHVDGVLTKSNGDIAGVRLRDSQDVNGDFFIDCSGTHALLIGEHYNVPFNDCSQFSINDTALAVQVPYESEQSVIASATIATAQPAGWTWDIGLSERRGVGYVYSSAHCSEEQAYNDLHHYLEERLDSKVVKALSARKLSIRSGHRQEFWHRNCVAIGMASGFIEPLEASALALVELSANFIRDELPLAHSTLTVLAKRFNKLFTYRWQRIVEFLKLHYALSERRDTDYWCDVTAAKSIPEDLIDQLALWRYRSPHLRDLMSVEELFPEMSYQFVLYGMGFKPDLDAAGPIYGESDAEVKLVKSNLDKVSQLRRGLLTNRAFLEKLATVSMHKI